jgi:hypothetical protein
MNRTAVLFLAAALTAGAAEPLMKVSVLDNAVLCVRASRVPDNVKEQIRAATLPGHLAGTVLDLRFADDAATNAADYFIHRKSPLVVLVNSRTRGAAAALAAELRASAAAILIGSTNSPAELAPDILVAVSPDDEQKFQDNPFFKSASSPAGNLSATNLLAFVDHTSEAELVRKHLKDGEAEAPAADPSFPTPTAERAKDSGGASDASAPRVEPPPHIVLDPALARAMDLLKALAALHPARG